MGSSMTPKVAVITPSYNDQEYIDHAIQSVVAQTYTNVVHYIYSDASTDSSIDIIKSHGHRYQQCHVVGDQNQGQAHGRNVLIDLARRDHCDIVAFLDSDDRWLPNHIENNLKYLQNHDIVYHNPLYQFYDGNTAQPYGFVLPHAAIPKNFLYRNFIFISTSLVKMSALDQVTFDRRLDSIEDWDFWCQLYQRQRHFVKNSEPPTAIYIIKPQNSSSQGHKKISLIKQKYPIQDHLKVNLGYNYDYDNDYINISPVDNVVSDHVCDIKNLPYDENTVDEIRVQDALEKLGYHEAAQALQNWCRTLRPGGRLVLTTVDFESICQQFVNSQGQARIDLYRLFFGDVYNNTVNKFLFTEEQLLMHLNWCKFSYVGKLPSQNNFITIEAIK
jgi:teichuronic acid biosynthesis glycosyltransferase TuaG